MKVTWYKMSEKQPETGSNVWFYRQDYEKGIEHSKIYNDCYYHEPHKLYWAYAELPEPPEEEKHFCSWEFCDQKWFCYDHADRMHLVTAQACSAVNFCPHCGKGVK